MSGLIHIRFSILIVAVLAATSCSKVWHTANERPELYLLNAELIPQPDSSIQSLIAPYKAEYKMKMMQQIGRVQTAMLREQPEGSLGNWMADIVHRKAMQLSPEPVDFAIVNHWGIRLSSIEEGPLTVGSIYELMPFDNTIMIVQMNGREVAQLFEFIAQAGGWPVSWPVRLQLMADKVVKAIIAGQSLIDSTTYQVAMPDYVANGGDGAGFLTELPRQQSGYLVREALLEHIRAETAAGRPISAKRAGRIQLVDEVD